MGLTVVNDCLIFFKLACAAVDGIGEEREAVSREVMVVEVTEIIKFNMSHGMNQTINKGPLFRVRIVKH